MEKKRSHMWVGFLGVAATLAIIPELFWEEEQYVQRSAHPTPGQPMVPARRTTGETPVLPPISPIAEERQAVPRADLFAAHSWYVPPPAPSLPPPPAPRAIAPTMPVAPPVPFQFVGTMKDNERLHIVLQRNQTIHVVGVGDVIDGTYRVEGLSGREVILVYLPLELSQSVLAGSTAGRNTL